MQLARFLKGYVSYTHPSPMKEDRLHRIEASRAHSSGAHRDEVQFSVAFEIQLVGRLWRTRFNERMKPQDQTEARWAALYMIADAPKGLTQTQLAERLGVQGPTLVRLLDALEHQGLVGREPAPDDRRAKFIFMLPKGHQVLAEVDKAAATLRDELFTGVSEHELEILQRVLRGLSHLLEPLRPFQRIAV